MFMYYYGSCDILYRNGQCFCLRRDSLVRNRNSCPGSGSRADFIRAGIGRDAFLLYPGHTGFGVVAMTIQNSVFYVGGSKGGVGKSLFSFALVDYLLNREANVLLVDTDTDNPDGAQLSGAAQSALPHEQSR